jgi:hypothetical protein
MIGFSYNSRLYETIAKKRCFLAFAFKIKVFKLDMIGFQAGENLST